AAGVVVPGGADDDGVELAPVGGGTPGHRRHRRLSATELVGGELVARRQSFELGVGGEGDAHGRKVGAYRTAPIEYHTPNRRRVLVDVRVRMLHAAVGVRVNVEVAPAPAEQQPHR